MSTRTRIETRQEGNLEAGRATGQNFTTGDWLLRQDCRLGGSVSRDEAKIPSLQPWAGTVFQLAPDANGKWTEKVLHTFNNNGTDGYNPEAGVIFDAAEKLYATTPVACGLLSSLVFATHNATKAAYFLVFSFSPSAALKLRL